MSASQLRVAAAQAPAAPADVERNAETAARLIGEAAGHAASVVVFPELFLCAYDLEAIGREPDRCDVTEDDPRLDAIRAACRDGSITAVVGASVRAGEARTISALVFGPGGEVVERADKVHVDRSESTLFTPGRPGGLTENGWRLAIGICRDGSFPEHARAAALAGAHAYMCPVAHHHVSVVHPARAFENTMYVVLSNHVAPYGNGGSMVYGPDGDVLADAGDAEGLAVASFDSEWLEELRRRRPYLEEIARA